MKRIALFSICTIIAASAHAQLTSLNETFNSACQTSSGPNYPQYWSAYSVMQPINYLEWNCTSDGEDGTGGVQCTGNYNGADHLDTAWLFTPELNLSGYSGNVYFQFDAKYDLVAGKLAVIKTKFIADTNSYQQFLDSAQASPLQVFVSPIDSSEWVTYDIDVTLYKDSNLYMAFRYVSNADSAGIWTIDNVLTIGTLLGVPNIKSKEILPLTVIGNSTADQIKLSYNAQDAGQYTIAVYDMMGRQLYNKDIYANNGAQAYSITGLHLSSGMYFIKMSNGQSYGTAKAVVQ